MFIMNSLIFCRRFSSFKFLRLNLSSLKCIENSGSKYVRNYTNRLLRTAYSSSQWQLYENNGNEFKITKRYKQTSSDQGKSSEDTSQNVEEPPEKLSLFKRYQKMLREYWYVMLPVHGVTSIFWIGGFYYAAKSGIDIVPFLEYINLPEKLIAPLRNSSLGSIAVASAFYKLATPARYMVTLGGTTFAIKFLTKRGLIKPAPTKAQIKSIIQNKLKKETTENKP